MIALDQAAEWMLEDHEHHRITIQRSIAPGYWLVRLEVGEHGHGACVWYGKAKTIPRALRGAFDAVKRDKQSARSTERGDSWR